MMAPDFWDRHSTAHAVVGERATVQRKLETYRNLQTRVADLEVLLEMAAEDGEEALKIEAHNEFYGISQSISDFEIVTLMAGSQDPSNAFLNIHAGAGGTESQDWAEMLYRMFSRWAERKGMEAELMDFTEGDGAGYRSVTMKITGPYAYGYLQNERGVHRLVRISPFNNEGTRQTAFASLYVAPFFEAMANEVEIDESGG